MEIINRPVHAIAPKSDRGRGVTISKVSSYEITISLPLMVSSHHHFHVIADLQSLQARFWMARRWIVDCDGLRLLPIPLIDALLTLGADLTSEGKSMELRGLSLSVMPLYYGEAIRRYLSL